MMKADITVGKLMCKKTNVSKATAFRLHDVGINFSISCKHLKKKRAVLLEILIFMHQFPHCDISFAFLWKMSGKIGKIFSGNCVNLKTRTLFLKLDRKTIPFWMAHRLHV